MEGVECQTKILMHYVMLQHIQTATLDLISDVKSAAKDAVNEGDII